MSQWGSPNAITDITAAAGWTIIGCSPDALAQDIRLVCNDEDTGAVGCDHLFQNTGAVDKLVRLPENCGKSAFARVSRSWVPDDQSLPEDVAPRFVGRAVKPRVQALALDTNFAAVNPTANGPVSIAIQGATVPGSEGNLTITPPTVFVRRRSFTPDRRGFLSFVESAFDKFNKFDKSVTKKLKAVNVGKTFPIFNKSVKCSGTDASIKADVNTNAKATITLGVATAGTIVPPKLSDFGLFAGLDATLDAKLGVKGNVAAKADSGEITFFEVGIPGLDFPGVLTLGPSFKILGKTTATLDVDVDMVVDLSYSVDDAKLFFPPSANHKSGGPFSTGKVPLKLSVSPSIASKAVVAAHVIPRLDVGVSALGGAADATIFLNLDTSASITMTLNAAASATVGVETTDKSVSKSANASVDGCISANTALNVNAGADASFFGIFDKGTTVPLFGKDFQLFKLEFQQKCFGAQAATKRDTIQSMRQSPRRGTELDRKGLSLSCPKASSANLVSVS
ncbi:hypothetical protein H0H87_009238 [Tephrocybe sp. NHM501043]|nr:hypothetical protein H0H87_009238 [Tephrocybe sp. NHM501043]